MAVAAEMGGGLKLFSLLFAFALPLSATTFYVTVAGLGGEPDYEQRFTMLADETEKMLNARGGDIQVVTLKSAQCDASELAGSVGKNCG